MTKNIKFYFFAEKLNDFIIKNIIKFEEICIIYKPSNINNINHNEVINIKKFCKKKNILFFLCDNFRSAVKYDADGIFLSSHNKNMINLHGYKKKFKIIGSAHNINEYFIKIRQKCETIMLSPIFYNNKYTVNRILGVTKFNLITLNWVSKICALGGINSKNLKKIKITKSSSIAFVSLLNSYNTKSPPMISMSGLFKN